jgi:hypothetical protein
LTTSLNDSTGRGCAPRVSTDPFSFPTCIHLGAAPLQAHCFSAKVSLRRFDSAVVATAAAKLAGVERPDLAVCRDRFPIRLRAGSLRNAAA